MQGQFNIHKSVSVTIHQINGLKNRNHDLNRGDKAFDKKKKKKLKTLEIGRTHLSIIKGIHHKPIATITPKRENLKAESLS